MEKKSLIKMSRKEVEEWIERNPEEAQKLSKIFFSWLSLFAPYVVEYMQTHSDKKKEDLE